MKKWFRDNRPVKIVAAALLIVMATITVLANRFDDLTSRENIIAVVLILAALLLYLLKKPRKWVAAVANSVILAGVPFLAVLLLQEYTQDPLGEKGIYPKMLAVNCLFAYLFYIAVSAAIGSWAWGYVVGTVVMMLIGIANYFVIQFRGSPIVPWDFYSLRTAASVAGNYTYEIHKRFLISTFGFIFLLLLSGKMTWKTRKWFLRLFMTAAAVVGLIFAGVQLQKSEVKEALGMDTTLFTPTVRYRNNGFLAAFIGNLHLINVEKPDGYSVQAVKNIEEDIQTGNVLTEEIPSEEEQTEELGTERTEDSKREEQESQSSSAKTAEETDTTSLTDFDLSEAPNIIVIMNEAFSDLSVLGEFGVDTEYMPNVKRIQAEYAGGYLMTSVKGGNTANTEYEFLSGDTMAFLPAGSVVFQQFIHDDVPTLATQLAELGYTTTGMHPYLPTGWNRSTVYPKLGFQTFLSIYDFTDATKLRDYVDDQSAFKKIISEYEDREDGEKTFIFEVTMQNHSGYSKEYPGFTEEVHLTDLSYSNTQTKAAEKYLTLIRKSDEAFGELIDYFETVDEPTIIVMFGDHEPTDYITNVIAAITGYDSEDSLEEQQKSYLVPYVVWNNFGMELDAPELTSVNYFAADLLSSAGLPLTEYQSFLLELQESLPVICANVYVDTDGVYHSFSEDDEEAEQLINTYNILAYNHLIDTSNRVGSLFSLTQEDQSG